MNNPHTTDVDAEITRLLHLAIIAQLQSFEATNNLEAVLESEYVPGSPEFAALARHISDVVVELTGDPGQSLPEVLMEADAGVLREMLIFAADQAERTSADGDVHEVEHA